ncbi:MAG: isoleucine--tRNA ligase [Acidobacteriales bacterium]|nr:isoleucine--tRNA ligase [Terriglobales bacterium]
MDLKSTINLPKTAFPMKASLPQNEPKILARWNEIGLYEQIRKERAGSPVYVLHDGPPYANGPIHLGHALNKCLKDFVVKSKTMAGFNAPYVPGWDCHGLPIEIKVDQQLGGKKLQMQAVDVRRECRNYAQKYLDLQRGQFKRMGILGRWDRPYSTMEPQYEAAVVRTLYGFFEQGFVYKGLRAVYWCMCDKTALAEAEVEYENHTSPSIWVKYLLKHDPAKLDPALAGKKVFAVIWTTTPWTLPASMAVAFHPDEDYVALESGEEVYIVAAKLAHEFAEKVGLSERQELARFPGKRLEYSSYGHPFLERNIVGVLADYVTMDTGTGVVHTAPSHGAEDFATGVKYGLEITTNVDEAGIIRNGLPEYDGIKVFTANQPIIELLTKRGALMHQEKLEHSYPHCWRCHNPIIFRATEQWFISMETQMKGGTLRQLTLEEIKRVKWDPAWGEERISNMIANRPDWCISRQRIWGVPIAIFLCENCGTPLKDAAVNAKVVALFERAGADAWFSTEADSLAAGATCAKCVGEKFKKETDILDVWFESGSSQAAVLGHEPDLPWPADLYVEGGDQFRGWFHSSLLCAMGIQRKSPYRAVLTSGWTLDEHGRPMSKSEGNVVDPVDIAERMGAEIVRLWVSSVDFREDVTCSEHLMQRVADNYRKIRNTFRYILGNLYDFDPQQDAVPLLEMQPLDQFLLRQTAAVSRAVTDWYEQFAFHKVYHRINDFCVVDLSAFYFDILKDRLYTAATKSRMRRSAQTALWIIGESLVRLLAPMSSFTADEIWQQLPRVPGRRESVHLEKFWTPEHIAGDLFTIAGWEKLDAEWQQLREIRNVVLKSLEEARAGKLIGGGLEARLQLTTGDPAYSLLERYKDQLRYLFIVSGVDVAQSPAGNGNTGIEVQVLKAPGQKCERCWNYSVRVGEDPVHPTVCERCSAALKQMSGVA